MARKYSKAASKKIERTMDELKNGTLKSGRSGKKVKSRQQAIAIGLSEARRAGEKVPRKPAEPSKGERDLAARSGAVDRSLVDPRASRLRHRRSQVLLAPA